VGGADKFLKLVKRNTLYALPAAESAT